ncbi:hypothetical protein BDZ94DRAFT_1282702 [Collybia nuda]|uniref:Probable 26S proteasome regulatory subunit p27 n=1 Tax=Collybia nuda TaxID=64659 RepID=A0A9P5Y6D2_9AGAR|nr:hypothetical protein BDZ94DRAFT_1282702 [Collybia nuda]
MRFSILSPMSPLDQARALMQRKENIEAEIEIHISTLQANDSTLQSPLVDSDGFPRADIDVYAVRGARVRIIELRNDLKDVMNSIGKALEGIYDPAHNDATETTTRVNMAEDESPRPFARVDAVAPGSPAAEAGLQREDLVIKFGQLNYRTFTSSSLQPLADIVASNENRRISIKILRAAEPVFLNLIPRKGWGGRGMLGCHIVPYSPPS